MYAFSYMYGHMHVLASVFQGSTCFFILRVGIIGTTFYIDTGDETLVIMLTL